MTAYTRSALGLHLRLQTDLDTARSRVTDALKAEGFGVLTEIDLRATLRQKLNVEIPPFTILGACNPPLAHAAISAAPETGLLLPCNVTLSLAADGLIDVAIVNPEALLALIDNPAVTALACEARERLERVAAALAAGG